MAFDLNEHNRRQGVIDAAIQRRIDMGLPEEKNITILYNEMAPLLGIVPVQISSRMADHLPSPAEMKDEKGEFVVPNKPCPKCGKITFLNSICQSCKDAEGGKYKSGYTCDEKEGGCGFVDEKTDEWITQRLTRMGREVPTGTKESLGIMTKTDDGLK